MIYTLILYVYLFIYMWYILLLWRILTSFLGASDGKRLPRVGRPGFDPWVRKIPWRKEWQPTPVFLPGEFHGQRSLLGYSPWSCKEFDMTEWLWFSYPLISFFILFRKKWRQKDEVTTPLPQGLTQPLRTRTTARTFNPHLPSNPGLFQPKLLPYIPFYCSVKNLAPQNLSWNWTSEPKKA